MRKNKGVVAALLCTAGKSARQYCLLWLFCASLWVVSGNTVRGQTISSASYDSDFNGKDFGGKWYMVMSNLHQWKATKNTDVIIEFEHTPAVSAKAEEPFIEHISFLKSGASRAGNARLSVLGSKAFRESRWKGMGIHLFGRHWDIVATDPGKKWLIIYVHGNLFRKDAIEVFSRSPKMEATATEAVKKCFSENYFLHAKTKRMRENIQH